MAVTQQELDRFNQFALDRIDNGNGDLTLEDLLDQWRIENPLPEQFAENVAAIQAAIDDMNHGDTGRDAGEVSKELRQELNFPTSE